MVNGRMLLQRLAQPVVKVKDTLVTVGKIQTVTTILCVFHANLPILTESYIITLRAHTQMVRAVIILVLQTMDECVWGLMNLATQIQDLEVW